MKQPLKKIVVTYITPFTTKKVLYDDANDLSRFFDSFGIEEQVNFGLEKLLVDSYDFSDSNKKDIHKVLIDSQIVSDEWHITVDFRRLFEDQLDTPTDKIQTKNFGKANFDQVLLEDFATYIVAFKRKLYDTFSFSEMQGKSLAKPIDDKSIAMEDYILFQNEYKRLYQDYISGLTDESVRNTGKGIFDSLPQMTDQLSRIVSYSRQYDDSTTISDIISKKDFTKLITDGFFLIDTISMSSADFEYDQIQNTDKTFVNTTKLITDDFSAMTDRIMKTDIGKILYQTIDIVETFNKVVQFIRSFNDSLSFTEQIQKSFIPTPKFDDLAPNNEDGIFRKDTYVDAQYYGDDFVESVNVYFKTIDDVLDRFGLADTIKITPNKYIYDYINGISDIDKSYIINNYVDSSFLLSNYIGSKVTI